MILDVVTIKNRADSRKRGRQRKKQEKQQYYKHDAIHV